MIAPSGDVRRGKYLQQPPIEHHKARAWVLIVYLILLALTIPWYWPAGDARHLAGLPLWVLATLAAVLATSIFTAWVFLRLSDDEPG
jgi:polyferredoxin